jgi:hypothetical protein
MMFTQIKLFIFTIILSTAGNNLFATVRQMVHGSFSFTESSGMEYTFKNNFYAAAKEEYDQYADKGIRLASGLNITSNVILTCLN